MGDIDSAGVYFLSVEEFESRAPARIRSDSDAREPEDRCAVDSTDSEIARPDSSPQSS